MKIKKYLCVALLLVMSLSTAAQADVVSFGPPPRNEQSEAFVDIYKDELAEWDDAYAAALDGLEYLVFWQYPGSGQVKYSIGSANISIELGENQGPCYVDGEGRFWTYINYAYGKRLAWVCLSDPGNDYLPANPDTVAAVDKEVTAMLWRERTPVILLVVTVVAVTIALICRFWYKKKKRG